MLPEFAGVKVVLLDIEGTVCPISFVKETLFPYALKALPKVTAKQWDDPAFIPYREAFPPDAQTPEALQKHVEELTAKDIKIAYLKNLQGYLWEEGYKSGAYSTPLFSDVVPELKKWKAAGYHLSIYSSGSVFAQKLLFGHVKDASGSTEDLKYLMSDWFDTTNAGLKTESSSYTKISGAINHGEFQPQNVLFLSDNVKEIEAATEVQMKAIVVDRPGDAPLSEADRERFAVIQSLEEIALPSLHGEAESDAPQAIASKRKADAIASEEVIEVEKPKSTKKSRVNGSAITKKSELEPDLPDRNLRSRTRKTG